MIQYMPNTPTAQVIENLQSNVFMFKGTISRIVRGFLSNDDLRRTLTADNRKHIEMEFVDFSQLGFFKCIIPVGLKINGQGRSYGQVIIEDGFNTGKFNIAVVVKADRTQMLDIYRVFNICPTSNCSVFIFDDSVRFSTNSIRGLEEILDVFESIQHSYSVSRPAHNKVYVGAGVL